MDEKLYIQIKKIRQITEVNMNNLYCSQTNFGWTSHKHIFFHSLLNKWCTNSKQKIPEKYASFYLFFEKSTVLTNGLKKVDKSIHINLTMNDDARAVCVCAEIKTFRFFLLFKFQDFSFYHHSKLSLLRSHRSLDFCKYKSSSLSSGLKTKMKSLFLFGQNLNHS